MSELLSGLFAIPFLTGLALAVVLPVLGCFLRLRHEWIAALAYGNVAAAGSLAALALGMPLVGGGLAASATAVFVKRMMGTGRVRATAYAFFLVGGWAVAVLLAANLPMAERIGHALFDGQLYFAELGHLVAALSVAVVVLPLLLALSRRLLLCEIFPQHFRLQGLPDWPVHVGFDLLTVVVLAAATLSLGVMAGFSLAFLSPWVAFARARSWRQGLFVAVALGVTGYTAAFALALAFDQPFGPMLCLVLLGGALAAAGISGPKRTIL